MSQPPGHFAPVGESQAASPGGHDAGFLVLARASLVFADGTRALQDVDLSLAPGEFHCLLGRSGCGKTTLLRLAAGLIEPTQGQVRVRGQLPRAVRSDIGFVFQAPTLLEWLTALDNVLLPVSLQRPPTAQDRDHAQRLLQRLGLGDLAQRRPRQLSGGQQSRVAIARALILSPALLLLDEPFASLDAITREELQQDLLATCREAGTTVLFVTHDIAEAVYLADRVSVLEAGRITARQAIDLPRPRHAALRATAAFAALGGALREAMHLGSGDAREQGVTAGQEASA